MGRKAESGPLMEISESRKCCQGVTLSTPTGGRAVDLNVGVEKVSSGRHFVDSEISRGVGAGPVASLDRTSSGPTAPARPWRGAPQDTQTRYFSTVLGTVSPVRNPSS